MVRVYADFAVLKTEPNFANLDRNQPKFRQNRSFGSGSGSNRFKLNHRLLHLKAITFSSKFGTFTLLPLNQTNTRLIGPNPKLSKRCHCLVRSLTLQKFKCRFNFGRDVRAQSKSGLCLIRGSGSMEI